jgi:hypothetical protein
VRYGAAGPPRRSVDHDVPVGQGTVAVAPEAAAAVRTADSDGWPHGTVGAAPAEAGHLTLVRTTSGKPGAGFDAGLAPGDITR